MQNILNFIFTNYRLIIEIVILVFSIIFFILRKKSVLVDNSAYKDLVYLVNEAENKFGSGHGQEKLAYVIERYCEINKLLIGNEFKKVIQQVIEQILSTPHKKE